MTKFKKLETKSTNAGYVFEIRDLIQDEAIVPQFCCKTREGAKRQFALFLSQNKLKKSDFRLNLIGSYDPDFPDMIANGSEVLVADYLDSPIEQKEE